MFLGGKNAIIVKALGVSGQIVGGIHFTRKATGAKIATPQLMQLSINLLLGMTENGIIVLGLLLRQG
jgi:hypothetical protein